VSSRSRIVAFGSAGLLVVAGGICAAIVPGMLGQLLTLVLMSLGFAGAVLLLFLEVGLSEDRARAREEQERARAEARKARPPHPRTPLRGGARWWSRRPG
jgi:hypothetical protein